MRPNLLPKASMEIILVRIQRTLNYVVPVFKVISNDPSLCQEIPNTALLTAHVTHTGLHCRGHPSQVPSGAHGNQATGSKTTWNFIKLTVLLHCVSPLTSNL